MPSTSGSQSFYQNASNFTIGTQNLTINNGPSTLLPGRRELPQPIPDASHNRNRKASPPDSNCLPGTREGVINKIISWAKDDNPDHAQIALWLCGSVGSGKSAISQAVAEALERCNRLAASFFFFRGSGDRSRFSSFPITLASQVAISIPETAPHILDAAEIMGGWSVSKQMEELVYKPIQLAFADRGSLELVSIVLDGLDECQDKEEVEEFIDHLLEYFEENPAIPLRFIIASRIEQHIQDRLESEQVVVENLAHHICNDDIRTFLLVTFSRAAKQRRVIRAYGKWPSDKEVATLLSHINGSFIFASTIVKYILGPQNDGLTPMERLPLALEMNPGLDGLYTETLKRCSHFPHFTGILAPIALSEKPLSILQLSKLLNIPTFKILNVLLHLQSIIHVPGDDHASVTIFHTSFRDFLTDANRSDLFFITPCHHDGLAFNWLKALCCAHYPDEGIGEAVVQLESFPQHHDIVAFVRLCLCHATYHWARAVRFQGRRNVPVLEIVQAFVNHCFPPSLAESGESTPWFIRFVPFYALIFHALAGSRWYLLEAQTLVKGMICEPPSPHTIPHSGNLDSILVHTGILFFNNCLPIRPGAASSAENYILCHWVKHLATAVNEDLSLAWEFLQRRDYAPFQFDREPLRYRYQYERARLAISFNSSQLTTLKDDVLVAQRAIEARFPGTLPSSFMADMENHWLDSPSYLEQSYLGLSVLDVFCAYRNFALMVADPSMRLTKIIPGGYALVESLYKQSAPGSTTPYPSLSRPHYSRGYSP